MSMMYTANSKTFPARKDVMLPSGTFEGKVALVTGGGTGLGKGMVKTLSFLGAKVAIMSRKYEVLKNTAEEITKETGNEVLPLQADVRKPGDIKTAIDTLVSKFGLPHIVINNAAGNFISPFERLSPNAFRTVVDIVLNGTANVILDVGKRLIAAKQGAAFLAITTPYAQTGSGFVVPSAAAKAGVENLTKSLTVEWSRYGMRFNAIAPGPIKTEGAFSRLDPTGEFQKRGPEKMPCKRFGEIEELANLAAYLVSDYSSWMHGEIINFDGGMARALSGEFNSLLQVTDEQWDFMRQLTKKAKL